MYQCCRKTQKTSSKKHSRNSDKNNLSNYKFASSKFFHLHWGLKGTEKHFSSLWVNQIFRSSLRNHELGFLKVTYAFSVGKSNSTITNVYSVHLSILKQHPQNSLISASKNSLICLVFELGHFSSLLPALDYENFLPLLIP